MVSIKQVVELIVNYLSQHHEEIIKFIAGKIADEVLKALGKWITNGFNRNKKSRSGGYRPRRFK